MSERVVPHRARWVLPAAVAFLVSTQLAGAGAAFAGRELPPLWTRQGPQGILQSQCDADARSAGAGRGVLMNVQNLGGGSVKAICVPRD